MSHIEDPYLVPTGFGLSVHAYPGAGPLQNIRTCLHACFYGGCSEGNRVSDLRRPAGMLPPYDKSAVCAQQISDQNEGNVASQGYIQLWFIEAYCSLSLSLPAASAVVGRRQGHILMRLAGL